MQGGLYSVERVRGKVGDKGVIEARGLPREIKKSRGWSLPNWSCAGFISFVAASICILLDGSMLGLHDILCAFSFSCPACPCSRPSPAASPPPPLGRPRSPASAPSKKNCIPRTRTTLNEEYMMVLAALACIGIGRWQESRTSRWSAATFSIQWIRNGGPGGPFQSLLARE